MSDDDQPADPWRTPAVSNPDPRQNRIDLSTDDSCDPGWRRTRRILDSSARDECAAATPKGRLLELPTWAGNEFIAQDGTRPTIRTFTPRRVYAEALELHLDVVLHATGIASTWAETVQPGDEVAVSGPGRGYEIDRDATGFLLAGDETAIPAICQLLEHLPDVPIAVHLLVRDASARVDLHRKVDVTWHVVSNGSDPHRSLSAAIQAANRGPGLRIWAAGEAAAMQRIRNYLFRDVGFPRSQANVRGYWKRTET